jgi:hypothetical protein
MASRIIHEERGGSVSIVQLITNPKAYHGKIVMVTGFLNMEFEGDGIYLHKDDYKYFICKNGLWCDIDKGKYNKFNKKYVHIVGTFNAERKGHMGAWSGSIENISKIWKPPKRKKLINL